MAKIIFGNKFISTSSAISGPSWVCYALMLRVSGCVCWCVWPLGQALKLLWLWLWHTSRQSYKEGGRGRGRLAAMFTFSGSLCEACENNICNFKHLRRVASCLVIFQHHQYTHTCTCISVCACACLSIFGCLALMTIFISIHYFLSLSLLLLLLLVITLVATLWLFIN